MIWTEQMLNLQSLVKNPGALKLRKATAINERGQIVGFDTCDNSPLCAKHGFTSTRFRSPSPSPRWRRVLSACC